MDASDTSGTAERQIGIPADVVREVVSAGAGTRSAIADPTALLSRISPPPSACGNTSTPGGRALDAAPRDTAPSAVWAGCPILLVATASAPARAAVSRTSAIDRTGQRLRQRHRRAERARARTPNPRAQSRERRRGRVATVPSFKPYADIDQFAVKMFENGGRGIGDKGKDNGLLIVVAVDDRKIRIEVGYDLEQFVTDGFAGETIRDTITPEFKRGNYGAGLLAGTTVVVNRIAQGEASPCGTCLRRRLLVEPRGQVFRGGSSLIWIIIVILSNRRRRQRRTWGGGPWSGWNSGIGPFGGGGFGGGFGGFGGGGGLAVEAEAGFGGFGGGRSGGGGASGGW